MHEREEPSLQGAYGMSNFPEYYKEIMSHYSAYKNGVRTEETKKANAVYSHWQRKGWLKRLKEKAA